MVPDPVLALPDQERTDGIWLSHRDPSSSVMMMVPELGAFVRVLLPVHLTDGYTVTFGAWLGVHPDELHRAFGVWWEPEYSDLALEGRLANALPKWGLLAVPAVAAVQNPDETPYIVGSSDPTLTRVLTDEWPHRDILDAIP
ncbi:MAG TPA: hypothetical protein VMT88_11380 [Actinomycetes bacterium]|nr:hypothetical protein [Actinomycetes bacterium]